MNWLLDMDVGIIIFKRGVMFEFLQSINFGRVLKAHDEEWQSLKYFYDGYHLVIKKGSKLPCPVYLIKEESEETNESK